MNSKTESARELFKKLEKKQSDQITARIRTVLIRKFLEDTREQIKSRIE